MNDNFKELQELLDFLFDAPEIFQQAKADGKIDLRDLPLVWPLFNSGQDAYENLGNPAARFRACTPDEKAALLQRAKDRFDIADDVLENLVERWLDAIVLVGGLVTETIVYVKAS